MKKEKIITSIKASNAEGICKIKKPPLEQIQIKIIKSNDDSSIKTTIKKNIYFKKI